MCTQPQSSRPVVWARAGPLLAWAQLGSGLLVPDLEEGVPGTCGHSHAIVSDPEAAHTVVMAGEDTCTVALHGIPDVAVEVVVAREQQPAAARRQQR